MNREHRTNTDETDALFEAYLSARLAGEEVEWSAFRDAHPEHQGALDEHFADFQRGQAALDHVGLGPERENGHRQALSSQDLDRVLVGVAAPRDATSFQLLGPLGRGGMALIERVWDARLQRPLARKVLPIDVRRTLSPPDRRRVARFLDEAMIGSRLQHPGILPIHEIGVDEKGRPFFTMPIVRGHDFGEIIRKIHSGSDGWSLPRGLQVVVGVCETVAYAHSKGVVHRDLKPENVMVGRFGETFVMDWGLAKVTERAALAEGNGPAVSLEIESLRHGHTEEVGRPPLATLDGEVVGTPSFMAPEQASGQVAAIEPLADQYAVGAILYELLSGHRPYDDQSSSGSAEERIRLIRRGPPTPVSDIAPQVPPELGAIVTMAMERSPLARYQDVSALAADLRASLEQRVVSAYRAGPFASLYKWMRRNRGLSAAFLLSIVLVVGGLAALSWIEAAHGRRLEVSNRDLRGTQEKLRERIDELRYASYFNDLDFCQRALAASEQGAEVKSTLDACDEDLRGWEWRYLRSLADTSEHVFRFDGEPVQPAISQDETLVATILGDIATVAVIEVGSGRERHRLPCRAMPDVLAFSPDGRWLAAWSRDQILRVLDLGSGEVREHAAPGLAASFGCFSPDGARILLRHRAPNEAVVLDVETGERVATLGGHGRELLCPIWSAGGQIVFGDTSGLVHLWDAATWTYEKALGFGKPVSGVSLLEDRGQVRVASAREGLLAALDLESGATVFSRSIPARSGHVDSVFSRDGRRFARPHGTGVEIVDLESGRISHRHGHGAPVDRVAFGASGRLLSLARMESVRIWDLDRGDARRYLGDCGRYVVDISVAPDGRTVVATAGTRLFVFPLDGSASHSVEAALGPLGRARHHPETGELVAVGQARRLTAFDPDRLEVLRHLDVEVAGSRAMAWTPDCRLLTATDRLAWRNASLWDLTPGGGCQPFTIPFEAIDAASSPDGHRFALVGMDGCLHLFDAATRDPLHRVPLNDMRLNAVAWAPDGRVVAVGGRTPYRSWDLFLVDPDRGEVVGTLAGHQNSCAALRFTPDGRLLSAGLDGVMRVHDIARRRTLLTLRLEGDPGLTCLDLSKDGRILAVGTNTGAVHAWVLED